MTSLHSHKKTFHAHHRHDVEAIATRRLGHVKQTAMPDPHTAAELSRGEIAQIVDDLVAAHGNWLPRLHDTVQEIRRAAEHPVGIKVPFWREHCARSLDIVL